MRPKLPRFHAHAGVVETPPAAAPRCFSEELSEVDFLDFIRSRLVLVLGDAVHAPHIVRLTRIVRAGDKLVDRIESARMHDCPVCQRQVQANAARWAHEVRRAER